MKYQATISLEFEAFDHPELLERERDLADWLVAFEKRFGAAVLVVKERRPRRGPRAPAPAKVWTGS